MKHKSPEHHRSDKGQTHKSGQTKIMRMPKPYEKGFLVGFDERTRLYACLHDSYSSILDDLGGAENCSQVKTVMVEKFVWCQFIMTSLESRVALSISQGKSPDKLFQKWLYASKTLNSLAHILGLERRAKMIENSLSEYIGKKHRRAANE